MRIHSHELHNFFFLICCIYFFLRLILNCDIENIDVRTAEPFDASILPDYEATNIAKILDESIFCDIYKLKE